MSLINPAFIILLIIGLFLLWCISNSFFISIGKIISNIINNIYKNLNSDDEENFNTTNEGDNKE